MNCIYNLCMYNFCIYNDCIYNDCIYNDCIYKNYSYKNVYTNNFNFNLSIKDIDKWEVYAQVQYIWILHKQHHKSS